MSLRMFATVTEAATDALAFAQAQQSELLAGRLSYSLIDGTTIFPSDQHALTRAQDWFGVQPQEQVSVAGAGMNMVLALRIHAPVGRKRLLFFGLSRV